MKDLPLGVGVVEVSQEEVYELMARRRAQVVTSLTLVVSRIYQEFFAEAQNMLEVGSGGGFLRRTLEPQVKWTELDHHRAEWIDHPDFVEASAASMPFDDESFDGVLGFESYNAFESFEDLEGALEESVRVLRPGGNFMVFNDFRPGDSVLQGICEERDIHCGWLSYEVWGSSVTAFVYLPPENKEKYEAAIREREQMFAKIGVMVMMTNDPLWRKYAKPMIPHDCVKLFHEYAADKMRPHFERVVSGVEYGIYCANKLRDQDFFNSHGGHSASLQFIRKVWKNKYEIIHHAVKTLLSGCLPSVEAVAIPYTVGIGKKSVEE